MTTPTPAASPTPKNSAAVTPPIAQPVTNNPADAKTKTFFERHKPYLIAWVALVGTALLWKGKAAAVAVGVISAALYTGYSWLSGRNQLPAKSASQQ